MNIGVVRRVPADEVDGVEGWDRLTNEPELRGIEAIRNESEGPWQWSVTVWAMEFVREDPLEQELRAAIAGALARVPGVTRVAEEDREVWVVDGVPSGEALVEAAAGAVDALVDRVRIYVNNLS